MNALIPLQITLLFYLDINTRGQIFISIVMLLIGVYLVDAYIREGKELKQMREEDAKQERERERKLASKSSRDHLRKV